MRLSVIYLFSVTAIYGEYGDLLHQAITNFTCQENYAAIVTKTRTCPMISYKMLCVKAIQNVQQRLTFIPGDCVAVIGTPTWNFQIDIKSNTEFLFHLKVRFSNTPNVVRSYTIDGDWQSPGEKELNVSEFPFTAGIEFIITLCAEENQFQAWLDDTPLFNFTYRYSITEMTRLRLKGNATFSTVVFF